MSVQHAVAAALAFGKIGIEHFTDACVRDPKVKALGEKVRVRRDESFSTIAAAVEIVTADGATHQLTQAAARGSDANPLSDDELEDKLRMCAAEWNPKVDATALIDAIWGIDKSADVSKLAPMTAKN